MYSCQASGKAERGVDPDRPSVDRPTVHDGPALHQPSKDAQIANTDRHLVAVDGPGSLAKVVRFRSPKAYAMALLPWEVPSKQTAPQG